MTEQPNKPGSPTKAKKGRPSLSIPKPGKPDVVPDVSSNGDAKTEDVPTVRWVTISLPIIEPDNDATIFHLDVNQLNDPTTLYTPPGKPALGRAAYMLFRGMQAAGVNLRGNTGVRGYADVVRVMLQRVVAEL